jgi:radical SAM superfamily enzyme YgiQ (UPF0313 family)
VEVKVVDEAFEKINFEEKVDLVGITAQTPVALRAYQIAEEFRKRGTPVVMGGVHASMLPQEALQHVDAVIVGEAEEVWPDLIEDLRRGQMRRIYVGSEFINRCFYNYCRDEEIIFTRSRSYKKNDSCHVEQKNGNVVRRLVGYERYASKVSFECLGRVYDWYGYILISSSRP